MMEENSFTKQVDELVLFADYDQELAENIKWLDMKAQKKGISFYDMAYEMLYKYNVNSKAKDWMKNR